MKNNFFIVLKVKFVNQYLDLELFYLNYFKEKNSSLQWQTFNQ